MIHPKTASSNLCTPVAMLDAGQYSWGGGPRPDAHVQPQPRLQPHLQMTDRSMVDRSAFIQYPNGKRQTQSQQANSKTSFLPDYPLGPWNSKGNKTGCNLVQPVCLALC
jgi:hypothetical protein